MGPWPSLATVRSIYSTTYAEARQTWLSRVRRCGAVATSLLYPHARSGPDGGALASDVLWLGNPDAAAVLVLISGTHGIEGYAGSAIQSLALEWVATADPVARGDVALLVIHALNPWGVAWYRRCDDSGIDLNRHFVDFDQPLPANPDFAFVRPWLREPDPGRRQEGLRELQKRLGDSRYQMALSGGQYSDPGLPFFGGTGPSFSRAVVEDVIQRFQLAARSLLVLDLHTGLGPWGYGELICDHAPGSAGARVARVAFGGAIGEPALGTSSSVPKTGLLDYHWHRIMNDAGCFLTLEFGSYSVEGLFDCIIRDHQYWASAGPQSLDCPGWNPVREALLEHFCPADIYWRQAVLARACQLIGQALDFLGQQDKG